MKKGKGLLKTASLLGLKSENALLYAIVTYIIACPTFKVKPVLCKTQFTKRFSVKRLSFNRLGKCELSI